MYKILLSPNNVEKSCDFFFSIEKCLKDLQLDVNEICTDEALQSTTDCIQWLNNCNFSSLRPSSTDRGELLEFLKTLVKIVS